MISYFNCGTVETLPIAIYSMTRKKVSPEIYALSTIMFVVILSIILLSNAMESREYRKDQRALRGATPYETAETPERAGPDGCPDPQHGGAGHGCWFH